MYVIILQIGINNLKTIPLFPEQEAAKVKVFDTTKILANEEGITQPVYSRDFLHLNEAGYGALNRELIHLLGL